MTKKDRKSQLLDSGHRQIRDIIRLKCDGDLAYGLISFLTLSFREKLLKICYKYLYLEPTQVVKERILR